ncbi:hypothetical protein PF005_g33525 [Phytophthora fragariae]|uniref:Reverse transcriptase RNase H-like domain-containing protein n=1 Tax=Phytophthora fragariae TaxID=53985 RepID=A0A6A3USZ2_9STRA|nr:hypothetical protein PF005_g33525 [Phytophthora fragariae]
MLIQGVVALSVGIVLPSYALGKEPVLIFQPLADQVMVLSVELAEQIASLSGGLNAWIGVYLKGASIWISAEHAKVEFLFVETTMKECPRVTKWIALRTEIPISVLKMQM